MYLSVCLSFYLSFILLVLKLVVHVQDKKYYTSVCKSKEQCCLMLIVLASVSIIGPGGGPPSRLEQCKTLFSAEQVFPPIFHQIGINSNILLQLAYLQENVPKKANGDIDFPAWVFFFFFFCFFERVFLSRD